MIKHIVVVGPTASGKTSLAIEIAKAFKAEIICADSRTVYKEMNIGTAKPTQRQRQLIKHYGLDLVFPNQSFNVSDFVILAKQTINSLEAKNINCVTVGGSGLYIDGLIYDYSFYAPNNFIRQKYQNWTIDELIQELNFKNIELPNNYKNKRHLISALERQGKPASSKKILPKNTVLIGINPGKEILDKRISERAQQMIVEGLSDEVDYLFNKYGNQPVFNGGAYSVYIKQHNQQLTNKSIIQQMIDNDKKLAKKQLTWFKRNSDIKWFADTKTAYNWLLYNFKQ